MSSAPRLEQEARRPSAPDRGGPDRVAADAAVGQAVEAVHRLFARVLGEAHLPLLAGLETGRRPRGNIEMHAEGARAVECESAVDLEEVEVGAHLDRAVAGVLHRQLDRPPARIDLDIAGGEVDPSDVGPAHDDAVRRPSRLIIGLHAVARAASGSAGGRARAWCRRGTAPRPGARAGGGRPPPWRRPRRASPGPQSIHTVAGNGPW